MHKERAKPKVRLCGSCAIRQRLASFRAFYLAQVVWVLGHKVYSKFTVSKVWTCLWITG